MTEVREHSNADMMDLKGVKLKDPEVRGWVTANYFRRGWVRS